MDWYRSTTGEWVAMVEGGFYIIRGGPDSWWFELVRTMGGVILATGRTWGSVDQAKAEADARHKR